MSKYYGIWKNFLRCWIAEKNIFSAFIKGTYPLQIAAIHQRKKCFVNFLFLKKCVTIKNPFHWNLITHIKRFYRIHLKKPSKWNNQQNAPLQSLFFLWKMIVECSCNIHWRAQKCIDDWWCPRSVYEIWWEKQS